MTARYAAYALALELKCPDVDAMLENMSIIQFMEWQAFVRIRAEERAKEEGQPIGVAGAASGADPNVGLRLLGAFTGFQKRRDKLKTEGRIH